MSTDTAATINRLVLTAKLAEMAAMRYTPAAIPALDLVLEHESQQLPVGDAQAKPRQTQLKLQAVAFGTVAEQMTSQALGSNWRFEGFLATSTRGKKVVFHIQQVGAAPSAPG